MTPVNDDVSLSTLAAYELDRSAESIVLHAEIARLRAEVERWASQQVYRNMALEITTLRGKLEKAEAVVRAAEEVCRQAKDFYDALAAARERA